MSRTISHYRLVSRLGKGGMGELYLAFDETLKRDVALKAIREEHRLSAPARGRFIREARVLSRLDHPGICRIFDYVSDDDADYLVLELIEGEDLRQLAGKPLETPKLVEIALQISRALAAAHSAGVVHRDIKPANVMTTATGQVKVLDFGLARTDDGGEGGGEGPATGLDADSAAAFAAAPSLTLAAAVTEPGSAMGTLRYMSPEQAAGAPVTAASDIFSLGLLVQELATGVPAYALDLEIGDLFQRIRQGTPLPVQGVRGDLARLIEDMTGVDPQARPTASEVAARLEYIADRTPRTLRRVAAAALVLVALGAGVKYTVDLRHQRGLAVTAEQEAERRRLLAEDLLQFQVEDLKEKLLGVGKLPFLEASAQKVLEYFESVPAAVQTDTDRLRRSQALEILGRIRMEEGDLDTALATFEDVLAERRELVELEPGDLERKARLGDAWFWIGSIHFLRGDLAAARGEFERYRDNAHALWTAEPTNSRWLKERAYAATNLAVVQDAEGDQVGALAAIGESVEVKRELHELEPEDAERVLDLANGLAWMGMLQFGLGEFESALATSLDERELLERHLVRDEGNMQVKSRLAAAYLRLAEASEGIGRIDEALRFLEQDLALAEELVAHDPTNAEWQYDFAVSLHMSWKLQAADGDSEAGRERARRALEIADDLVRREPTNQSWIEIRDNFRVAAPSRADESQ